MGDDRSLYKISVRNREGNRPCGRSGRRWKGIIKTHLKGIGWKVVGWIHWTQNRALRLTLVNIVMNVRKNAANFVVTCSY
jgi:hypothetical protein